MGNRSCKAMTAPAVDDQVSWGMYEMNDYATDKKTVSLIDRIVESSKAIKPCDRDGECRSFWIHADRGTFSQFKRTRSYGHYYEGTLEDLKKEWETDYPEPRYWYEVTTISREDYRAVIVERELMQTHNEKGLWEKEAWYSEDLLRWIADSALCTIEMIRNGTYHETVSREVSFDKRTGTIRRSDLWNAIPEYREYDFKGITDSNVEKFLHIMGDSEKCPDPTGRIERMTASAFYECCAIGYAANDYDGTDLPPKEQYYMHADGRDENLKDIDPDDPDAFDRWLEEDSFHGGHPWEVCRGGNSTHVSLYVDRDDRGFYLTVCGDHREAEAVNFYLGLLDKGYPVELDNARALADLFKGTDLIGIVPHHVIPKYCDGMFLKEDRVKDFMHVYREDYELLKPYITWYELDDAELADSEGDS